MENARGQDKIGTTLRGIGPAYTDKVARSGLRMEIYALSRRSYAGGNAEAHPETSTSI
jgi:adenylosuccinate synthase